MEGAPLCQMGELGGVADSTLVEGGHIHGPGFDDTGSAFDVNDFIRKAVLCRKYQSSPTSGLPVAASPPRLRHQRNSLRNNELAPISGLMCPLVLQSPLREVNLIEASPDPAHLAGTERGRFVWLRRLAGPWSRVWAVIVVLSLFVPVQGGVAQGCSISRNDWDDIERFRGCIEERGLDPWSPWILHRASRLTTNPTIVCLLLQAGADPNAPDDNGRAPLHHGARNSNPMVVSQLLDVGADLDRSMDLAWDIRGSAAYWRLVVPEGALVPGGGGGGQAASPRYMSRTLRPPARGTAILIPI